MFFPSRVCGHLAIGGTMLFDELLPFQVHGEGVLLYIRAVPKSRIEKIAEVQADAQGRMRLKVHVHAAPTDGKANLAIVRLLARETKTAPSQWQLVQGASQRDKTLFLAKASPQLFAQLHQLLRC